MEQVGPGTDESVLLDRLRFGEDAAFGELFERHATAVRRLARGLASDSSEAEDITAETFFRVLQAMRRGSGPRDNIRAYLLTVARRVSWEWHGNRRDIPVTDDELASRAGSRADSQNRTAESTLITRAFSSLPERWRTVLWQTEVEGVQPAHAARGFGLSANATAALARRARLGLRAAYLQAHLAAERSAAGCRTVVERLGAYTAGGVTGAEARKIKSHLGTCASCRATHDELRDVCYSLRAEASALVLLVPAAGLVGAVAGSAGAGGGAATAAASSAGVSAGAAASGGVAAGGAAVLGKAGVALVSTTLVGAVGIAGPLVLPQFGSDIDLPGDTQRAELHIADPTSSRTSATSVISGSAIAADEVPASTADAPRRQTVPRRVGVGHPTATGVVSVQLDAEVDPGTAPPVGTELPGESRGGNGKGNAYGHDKGQGDNGKGNGRSDLGPTEGTSTPLEATTVSSPSRRPHRTPSTGMPSWIEQESSGEVGTDGCGPATRCAPAAPPDYRGE